MEKISHIIPPSTRTVWSTGEVPKPKRLAVPEPEVMGKSSIGVRPAEVPISPEEEASIGGHFGPRGSRVNVRA